MIQKIPKESKGIQKILKACFSLQPPTPKSLALQLQPQAFIRALGLKPFKFVIA